MNNWKITSSFSAARLKKLFLLFCLSIAASGLFAQSGALPADSLFKRGVFKEARAKYLQESKTQNTTRQLGYIALLSNKFEEAEAYLKKSIESNSADTVAKKLLSECYYRQDKFAEAAAILFETGAKSKANQLKHFADKVPYSVQSKKESTSIKFEVSDPLPVVKVKINGNEYNFILDTGGPELIIDDDLAKELSLTTFGSNEGEFAGGKKRLYQYAFLESIQMGNFRISNLPVNILSTKKFSAAAGGLPVSGIIGTVFLYHFHATINYKDGELVISNKNESNRKQLYSRKSSVIPFWMAGDHFMVAWGSINDSDSSLFFLDTGLAGPGFTAPSSTLDAAKVKFLGNTMEGEGGGGTVKVNPFIASNISFAGIIGNSVVGVSGAFPASLEYGYKFRIGGLISHSFFKGKKLSFDFSDMKILVE